MFDPCDPVLVTSPEATADQQASLDSALASWHALGANGPTDMAAALDPDVPQVTVRYRDASGAIYGVYDDTDATIYVNTRVDDASQRAITIAHELGHALGLVHVAADERPSVMNPGNLTIAPNVEDAAELARLWGACSGATQR